MSVFRFLNAYSNEAKKAPRMDPVVMPWLTGCAQNMLEKCWKEEDKEKLGTHNLRTGQKQLIKCVCPLSISTPLLHSKQNKWLLQPCPSHSYTEDSIFLLWTSVFVCACVFFPRTLIKIHQKKCFQQQCLRMLPPPLSSIKSGSSSLKGDEKLSLTLCHTPVKRRAHSKQGRVQVLIYYFTQIIFLPFFLTVRTFTSQMELSVLLWAFADLGFCLPWWKRIGKKRIGSLLTGATLMFVSK